MNNVSTTFRSPKKNKQEMFELLTIINVFKKNKKLFYKQPSHIGHNIQFDEPSMVVSSTEQPSIIKQYKQKSNSTDLISLKQILDSWQAKQVYIRDHIVSQNISKNKIIEPGSNIYYYQKKKTFQTNRIYNSQRIQNSIENTQKKMNLPPLNSLSKLITTDIDNNEHKQQTSLNSITKKIFSVDKKTNSNPNTYMPQLKLPPIQIGKINQLNNTPA